MSVLDDVRLGRPTLGEEYGRLPLNNPSRQLENSRIVKTGDGWCYGFTVSNTSATAQFVQVFDAAAVPATGAVPLISKALPASDAVGFSWLPPRRFEAGFVLCNSTTAASLTLGTNVCLFDAQYI